MHSKCPPPFANQRCHLGRSLLCSMSFWDTSFQVLTEEEREVGKENTRKHSEKLQFHLAVSILGMLSFASCSFCWNTSPKTQIALPPAENMVPLETGGFQSDIVYELPPLPLVYAAVALPSSSQVRGGSSGEQKSRTA